MLLVVGRGGLPKSVHFFVLIHTSWLSDVVIVQVEVNEILNVTAFVCDFNHLAQ